MNPPKGTNIQCTKFGSKTSSIIITGDNQGYVRLWKITENNPLINFKFMTKDKV